MCRSPRRVARSGVVLSLAAITLVLSAPEALAQDSTGLPRRASVALEVAHRYARLQPVRGDTVVLAAQGTQDGHWRFVNRAGEMFTVGNPDEMKRVVAVLYPQAQAGARLALYMTPDTAFRHGVAFRALPASAEMHMVVGDESYRVLRRNDPAKDLASNTQPGAGLLAEVRSNLAIELNSQASLDEALWHLGRSLSKARPRLLALEPGGPTALPAAPRLDAGSRRVLVDVIDPASLAAAMAGMSGQTLVLLGRLEREQLYVRPARGPEQSLALKPLLDAADAADVSLLLLIAASTPRQPGEHNLLWQPGGRAGSEAAPDGTLADLLNGVAGPSRRMAVTAVPGGRRTALDVSLVGDLTGASAPRPADARFSGLASSMAAAGVYGVRAHLLSAARQSDLDHRILPGIPLAIQAGYAALLALGLLGAPVARIWWARVWPPEEASEYAGRAGYWAARGVRFLALALIFLPLTALVAAPCSLGDQIRDALRGPRRWLRRMARTGADTRPAPASAGPQVVPAAAAVPARPSTPPPAPAAPPPIPAWQPAPPPAPPSLPPPMPLQAPPARQKPERKPARSWIAALPTEEDA